MYRLLSPGIVLLLASHLAAQNKPPAAQSVAALREAAAQKTQAWDALAKSLETRIATLLPCDPKITSNIESVSQASISRLAALTSYYDAAITQAASVAPVARQFLDRSTRNEIGVELLETERAETAEQRASLEPQLAQLSASLSRRAELITAEAALRDLATLIDMRNMLLTQQTALREPRLKALRDLITLAQAREEALRELFAAHAGEAARWQAYYAARLDRAKAECAAISPAAATPRTRGDKQ